MAQYDYEAEARREREEYDRTVARLSNRQRAKWFEVFESYEYFDGEYGIALSVLIRMIEDGSL